MFQQGSLAKVARKRGPAVWVFRFRVYGQDGIVTRRAVRVGTVEKYPTAGDAARAAAGLRLLANPENPALVDMTMGALLDRWLADELPERHSTAMVCRSYIEKHIRPRWGAYPLSKMTERGAAFTIEQWLKGLALAPKTKGNIKAVMSVVLGSALRWGLIEGQNPMAMVRVKGVSRRKTEPRVLSGEAIQRLLAELNTEPARTMVITALSTGLRCSELFALKWMDFDWESLTVLVRRAIVDGVIGDVKTVYSRSGLPLDPALAGVLYEWKHTSRFNGPEDWVFASPQNNGRLPRRATSVLEQWVKPAAQRAGLGAIGWHTFRHTYSTMLRQIGVDVKVQQELLRHADIRTTLNLYTQAISDAKRCAHSQVVRLVLPESESNWSPKPRIM